MGSFCFRGLTKELSLVKILKQNFPILNLRVIVRWNFAICINFWINSGANKTLSKINWEDVAIGKHQFEDI